MPPKLTATYYEDSDPLDCTIIKRGKKRTRILLAHGITKLVPSELVVPDIAEIKKDMPARMVPVIPLERFYRRVCKLTRDKEEGFWQLRELLGSRHGPRDAGFLAELFLRSVSHAGFYDNADEPFHPQRQPREEQPAFANRLVEMAHAAGKITYAEHTVQFVDYEIAPFRTTRSRLESGEAATGSGGGGVDLLLAADQYGELIPAIAEIKAATESTGPTHALVQALTYAAQLATLNQFTRIAEHYPVFTGILAEEPELDVLLIFEKDSTFTPGDLDFAKSIAAALSGELDEIRRIIFLSCGIASGEIKCGAI